MTDIQQRVQEQSVELAEERAVNERYFREHRSKVANTPAIQRASGVRANHSWVGGKPPRVPLRGEVEPLVGRVVFDTDDPDLGQGFYVGSWSQQWEGIFVVSWAAPKAQLFYKRKDADDELASNLIARRTLLASGEDLVDFEDELLGDMPTGGSPFARKTELRVPSAPTPIARRVPPAVGLTAHDPAASSAGSRNPVDRLPAVHASTPSPRGSAIKLANASKSVMQSPVTIETPFARPQLRAQRLVLEVINRPRTGRLGSLLATLQPEQYRLVTWPDAKPLLVQGGPGTGKTVIAAHRSAYLANAERDDRLKKVLLVGPTDAYVSQVAASVRQLEGSRSSVQIRSLPGLLTELGGLADEPREETGERLDGDRAWAGLICKAAELLRGDGRLTKQHTENIRRVVIALLERDGLLNRLAVSDEQRAWLAQLGRFERAQRSSRYLPFLAAVGLAVRPIAQQTRWEHVLVDEAQDIRPLEWWILKTQLQLGPARSVSLFGDMNQRRSDWSCESWEDVALQAGLEDVEVVPLDCGFRSTTAILNFANQLLPKSERRSGALREGTDPVVGPSVPAAALAQAAVAAADELSRRHQAGTIAVISMDQAAIALKLRKSGWARSRTDDHGWTRDGRTVRVLDPGGARGLEFDGVVVVEPADFPINLGRHGALYTSLTRATQELSVVHSRPLPRELRARRR